MHGFISKGVLCFVRDVHGPKMLDRVVQAVGVDLESPELYLTTDETVPTRAMTIVSNSLNRPLDDVLEDFGTYLICHENTSALRRLMRFSGHDFEDFLAALPDLAPRVRMAVPGLLLPAIDIDEFSSGRTIRVHGGLDGFAQVIVGVIRAMADDYGALVQVDLERGHDDLWLVQVIVFDTGFGAGREFSLLEVAL